MSSSNFKKTQSSIESYTETCGSRYAATVFVSSQARRIADKYDILHSEAISWLLTKDVPDSVINKDNRDTRRSSAETYADDALLYVHDTEIQVAVRRTLEYSSKYKHLIYRYNGVKEENKRARIRVLSIMLWDKMRILDYEDNSII